MPIGKKAILVTGSVQTASWRGLLRATTSIKPALACGASVRESDGRRTSQSTRMTRAPPCAIISATPAASVDFPSLGRHDVTPMTLLGLLVSTVSFIDRIASAYGENGASTTARNIALEEMHVYSARSTERSLVSNLVVVLCCKSGTTARHSVSRTACTWPLVRKA